MSIDVTLDQGVLILSLNRPDKKNALNKLMYQQLVQQLQQAAQNDEIKVLLLQGSAECFSSGNDLADFLQSGELNDAHPTVMFLYEMAKFPKPVVAAVAGLAIGIGTTVLLHCDLVYSTGDCRFQLPFTQLGLCPEAGSSLLLPLLIGHQRASSMLLLSEAIDGNEAYRLGLVNQLVDKENLLEFALNKAKKLSALPADAVQSSKKLMKSGSAVKQVIEQELADFSRLLKGPECQQVIQQFFKR
ncbi:MAG: enoyl-CoA hydratase/isomerase family protein [Gammaproteobacteria bacterium]|nr:enoyl-CoA hydratase/isomerase family protein [Gammaproteobacteria bacterium]MBU2057084.1 enoyl-CoA hydratase/isomerase family protein [Gammaproteobacteria bacterium]MBU2175143.1 enoyl-CoA hydratase/isomerase family protein [Gammaproteobacteria bacterium]MBU2245174.1 enoyl-CoA hydratase/isomerase family protein [Gammaproteobacteria bacterium]MBU2343535.1 enoyl-CoA hydratase/isomerase family protein [Gammaproteobacteria bacterium]